MAIDDARQLIANGADINAMDNMSRTPLHIACWKGDSDMVQLLLRSKALATAKAKDNFTALHFAVQSGSLECCRLLLENSKTLGNMRISKGNKTALHIAATKGNIDIIELLLQSGVDPMALTNKKQTALDFASDDAVFQIIRASIERKMESDVTKISMKTESEKTTDMPIQQSMNEEQVNAKKRPAPSSSSGNIAPPAVVTIGPVDGPSVGPSVERNTQTVVAKPSSSNSISSTGDFGDRGGVVKLDLSKRKKKRTKLGAGVHMAHLYEEDEV
jgi:ankyrin repeat protein